MTHSGPLLLRSWTSLLGELSFLGGAVVSGSSCDHDGCWRAAGPTFPETFTLKNIGRCSLQSAEEYSLSFSWGQKPEGQLGMSSVGTRSQVPSPATLRGLFHYPRLRDEETEDHRLFW